MEGEKYRCHYSMIFDGIRPFFGFVGILLINGWSEIKSFFINPIRINGLSILLWGGIFVLVSCIYFGLKINRWCKTTVIIDKGVIFVKRNTLNKKSSSFAINTISNIDLEQGIMNRIFGAYVLKIDTNSKVLAKDTDIKILFSKDIAFKFKEYVLSQMKNEVDQTAEIENKDADIIDIPEENKIRYSKKRILAHSLYSIQMINLVIIIFIVGGTVIWAKMTHEKLTLTIIMKSLLDFRSGSILAFIFMISNIIKIVSHSFKYYGFNIKRENNELKVEYGFFTKNHQTIPLDRINGVEIEQPFVARLLKKYYLKVINIGSADEKNEVPYLLLGSSKNELVRNMKIILPEYAEILENAVCRQSKIYFIQAIVTVLKVILFFGFVEFIIISFLSDLEVELNELIFILSGIALLTILIMIMIYFTEGIAISENNFVVSKGILMKKYTLISYEKIQNIKIKEVVVSKFTDYVRSEIIILSGRDSTYTLPLMQSEKMDFLIKSIF